MPPRNSGQWGSNNQWRPGQGYGQPGQQGSNAPNRPGPGGFTGGYPGLPGLPGQSGQQGQAWGPGQGIPGSPNFPGRPPFAGGYRPPPGPAPGPPVTPPGPQPQQPAVPAPAPPAIPAIPADAAPTPEPTGILGAVKEGIENPFTHEGLPEIRPTNPVDVPDAQQATGPLQATSPIAFSGPRQASGPVGSTGPLQASGPVGFSGPSQMSYGGQRVGPGQQYNMQGGTGVGPGQQFSMNPNSGSYFQGQGSGGFAGQGNSLEAATFQRGLNRIDPYMQEQRSAMAQRLQNQGLPIGSEAYNQELNRFDRSRGDQLENLALSSVGAGRQEQGRLFGQDMASRRFSAGEQSRRFGEGLATSQFNAGESGRGFREALAGNQALFGQNLASNQFNAGESGRNFGERFAGEGQYFGQQQARDQFAAQQAGRRDQQGIQQQQFGDQFSAGQHQFANQFGAQQQQFGDQFAANQGRTADQQGIQQQQFGDQFGAGQSRFADQFGGQQRQQQFQNLAQQQAQQFQQDTARRGIAGGERLMERQLPQHELQQLLAMTGVGQPGFQQTPNYGPMPVNYGQMQQQNYQNQVNRPMPPWFNALTGGGQAYFSDRRLKRNIKKLGRFMKGIDWYSFRFAGSSTGNIGFMADEVEKVLPEAVHDVNGFKAVDYGMVFNAARA